MPHSELPCCVVFGPRRLGQNPVLFRLVQMKPWARLCQRLSQSFTRGRNLSQSQVLTSAFCLGAGAVACLCPRVLSRSWCPRCPHRRTHGSEGLPMLSFPICLISGREGGVWCPVEGRWVSLTLPCPLSLVLSAGRPRGPACGGHGVVVIWGSAIAPCLSPSSRARAFLKLGCGLV